MDTKIDIKGLTYCPPWRYNQTEDGITSSSGLRAKSL